MPYLLLHHKDTKHATNRVLGGVRDRPNSKPPQPATQTRCLLGARNENNITDRASESLVLGLPPLLAWPARAYPKTRPDVPPPPLTHFSHFERACRGNSASNSPMRSLSETPHLSTCAGSDARKADTKRTYWPEKMRATLAPRPKRG